MKLFFILRFTNQTYINRLYFTSTKPKLSPKPNRKSAGQNIPNVGLREGGGASSESVNIKVFLKMSVIPDLYYLSFVIRNFLFIYFLLIHTSLVFLRDSSFSLFLSLQKTLTCSRFSRTWPRLATRARCVRVTTRLLNSLWATGRCWSLFLTAHTPWPTAKWPPTADTSPAASPRKATTRPCLRTPSTPPTAPSTSWEDVLPSPTRVGHTTASLLPYCLHTRYHFHTFSYTLDHTARRQTHSRTSSSVTRKWSSDTCAGSRSKSLSVQDPWEAYLLI